GSRSAPCAVQPYSNSTTCNLQSIEVSSPHLQNASSKEAHDVARTLRSSLLLVHAEGPRRAVRKRHSLRIPPARSGLAPALRGLGEALALAQVPGARRRR